MWDDGKLDSKLDAALTRYVVSEPRAGLERRVLANLRTTVVREKRAISRWWAISAATACVLAIAGALLLSLRSNRIELQAPVTTKSDVAQPNVLEKRASQAGAAERHDPPSREPRVAARIDNSRLPSIAVEENAPKLERFPAPEPLSPQEALLVRYVGSDPQNAELMAEAITVATERRMTELGISLNLSAKDSDQSTR
jgi:hypothetical protein